MVAQERAIISLVVCGKDRKQSTSIRLFISHTKEAGGICFLYSMLYSAAQIQKRTTADNPHPITTQYSDTVKISSQKQVHTRI